MKPTYKFAFFCLFIFCALNMQAQVRGRIIDKANNSAIEFANIFIEHTAVGVMANKEGEFILNIPAEHQGKNIIISCMGFEPDTILAPYPKNQVLIRLTERIIKLPGLTVKPINPLGILRKALRKIHDNYIVEPVCLNAYYREMVNTDRVFVKYTDAACQIYYCGYNQAYNKAQASSHYNHLDFAKWKGVSPFPQAVLAVPHPNDAVKIIEARKSDNLEHFENQWGFEESIKKFDIGGGPLHITSADIVKFRSAVLDSAIWKHYRFIYEGLLQDKNREVHKILFKPKGNNKASIWQGALYIEQQSLAFVEFDFSIRNSHLKHIIAEVEQTLELERKERKQLKKEVVKRLTKSIGKSIKLIYSEYNSKWYPSYIKVENTYLNTGDVFDDIVYRTFLELYVNDVKSKDLSPIEAEDAYYTNQHNFLFHKTYAYNPAFWKTYNTPVPNKLFKEALLDIEKRNSLENQFLNNSQQP